MKEIMIKRRQAFQTRCLKYLRYVLNDHFVLVLLFLLGFGLYQYHQLLTHFPKNSGLVIAGLVFIMGGLLPLGNIATYLEPADNQFVLTKELELVRWIRLATTRAFIFWGILQSIVMLGMLPIFQALGVPLLLFFAIVVILWLLKAGIMYHKQLRLLREGKSLNWEQAIASEMRRQQSLLKFFALFTTIKGISTSVKRRAYLDKLTSMVTKNQSKLWLNLYLRAFLRSGDYLGLTLRLAILALACAGFVQVSWLAVAMVLFFNYLLGFQLLSLYRHYDYQYATALFPIKLIVKQSNLLAFLRGLLYGLTVLEMLALRNLLLGMLFVVLNLFLVEGYLRYKVKKMID